MTDTDTKPTLVLISGFARAGKDTFADGMVATAPDDIFKESFATSLKDAADEYLTNLGIINEQSSDEKTFHDDAFKTKHRDVLVTMGRFARQLDQNVFARILCESALYYRENHQATAVVVPDCRYPNEVTLPKAMLLDWRIVTVRITTTGAEPANEEEERSIFLLDREVIPDHFYAFGQFSAESVRTAGRDLARTLSL